MANITLNKKNYELKFTYKSLRALEEYYQKGVFKVFKEEDMDKLETINVFLWACLRREPFFKTKTVDDIVDLLDNALEDEEVTLESITQAVQVAFTESTVLKTAKQEEVDGAQPQAIEADGGQEKN